VHHAFDVRKVTFSLGLGVAVTFLRQDLPRKPHEGILVEQERKTAGAHGDLSLGLQYALPQGFYVGAEGYAMLYLFDVEQSDRSSALEAIFAARLALMVGKRF